MKRLAREDRTGTCVRTFHPDLFFRSLMLVWALGLGLHPALAWAQVEAGGSAREQDVEAGGSAREQKEDAPARYEDLVHAAIAAQETGDFARAYERFASAHALYPNARTQRAMGVAAFQEGRVVEAIRHLEASLDHPERPLDAELRKAVEELLGRARTRVTAYRVSVDPSSAWLSLDGGPRTPLSPEPLLVAPGEHTLDVGAEHHEPQRLHLLAVPNTSETVRISLAPRSESTLPDLPEASSAARADAEHAEAPTNARLTPTATRKIRRRRVASFVLMGTAGAAALAATGLWFGARHRVEVIADGCRERPGSGCTVEERDNELRAARLSTFEVSTTAMVVLAGSSAAAAAGMWLWNRVSLSPRVEPGVRGANLALSGRF